MILFAQNRGVDAILTAAGRDWMVWLPLAIGALAIYLLLPRPRPFPTLYGAAVGLGAIILALAGLLRPLGVSPEVILFTAFSGLAVASGALLVTQSNPARAALSFALVVLSTCGLFLLLAAPFLMAATIIVYAGAIIVTFLFVIMLAQQHGYSDADMRSREPALATLTGFLLLGVLIYVVRLGHDGGRFDTLLSQIAAARAEKDGIALKDRVLLPSEDKDAAATLFTQAAKVLDEAGLSTLEQQAAELDWQWGPLGLEAGGKLDVAKTHELLERLEKTLLAGKDRLGTAPARPGRGPDPAEIRRDEKTRIPHLPAENTAYLGQALFRDFLLPVELAGTLLLVATVGAIAIAQRRGDEERRSGSPILKSMPSVEKLP